jgi:hypothetical protein
MSSFLRKLTSHVPRNIVEGDCQQKGDMGLKMNMRPDLGKTRSERKIKSGLLAGHEISLRSRRFQLRARVFRKDEQAHIMPQGPEKYPRYSRANEQDGKQTVGQKIDSSDQFVSSTQSAFGFAVLASVIFGILRAIAPRYLAEVRRASDRTS